MASPSSTPSPRPSDAHVYTYLCLSLMSTGLHTEPYRISCHCRRMPAWDVLSPRVASRVVRESRLAAGQMAEGPPALPPGGTQPAWVGGHSHLCPTDPAILQTCLSGALGNGKGRVKGSTPKLRSFSSFMF